MIQCENNKHCSVRPEVKVPASGDQVELQANPQHLPCRIFFYPAFPGFTHLRIDFIIKRVGLNLSL